MKRTLLLTIVGLFALCSSITAQGDLYIYTENNDLYQMDPGACTATLIGNTFPFTFADIAFHPVTSELYAIRSNGALYTVDITDASVDLIGPSDFGWEDVNSLVITELGRCFAYGNNTDSLYEINLETSDLISSTTTLSGIRGAGDLTIFQGEMYLSGDPNWLMRVDTEVPSNSEVIGLYENLAAASGIVSHACNNQLLAFADNDVHIFSPANILETTPFCVDAVPDAIIGATSTTEAALSSSELEAYLDDQLLCDGGPLIVDATRHNSTYFWSDGTTEPTISVTEPGTFSVTIIDECGAFFDEFEVIAQSTPFVNFGNDTTICDGESLFLDATVDDADRYVWQDGSDNSTFTVTESGLYQVFVENECGFILEDIEVTVVICTSTDEEEKNNSVDIFPTVTSDVLNVVIKSDIESAKFQLIHSSGVLMMTETVNNGTNKLDLSNLTKGIYYTHVTAEGRTTHVEKIVLN